MPRVRRIQTTPIPWLRRLDFLPPRGAWAIGIGGGAVAGAALAGAVPGAAGFLGFLALLGIAAALAASGEPIAVLEQAAPVAPPPLVDLVEIPGGSFRMGSPESEVGRRDWEGPVHEVRLSPFACMRFPVTRRLCAEFLGEDPGWPKGYTDDRPVNNVSWFDAIELCNRLSEREGLEPCYRIEGEEVQWNRVAGGYRLLTEAEWEYACRAGAQTCWSFGDDEERLGDHACYVANSNGQPEPAGRKLPNAWGLHDMHGNVWEWCWDWYGEYSVESLRDPAGPAEGGAARAVRGGAYNASPGDLRSAIRAGVRPSDRFKNFGFRCARSPGRVSSRGHR